MFLIFDTETSSIPDWGASNPGMSRARIVQLGCILLSESFDEVASFASLIKVPSDLQIDSRASDRHGITLEMCQRYGIPIDSALTVFDEFSKLADYVVSFNLRFDSFLLATEIVKAGRPLYNIHNGTSGLCMMLAATKACKHIREKGKPGCVSLTEAVKLLLFETVVNSHDALSDTRYTGKILKHLLLNNLISLPRKELLPNE